MGKPKVRGILCSFSLFRGIWLRKRGFSSTACVWKLWASAREADVSQQAPFSSMRGLGLDICGISICRSGYSLGNFPTPQNQFVAGFQLREKLWSRAGSRGLPGLRAQPSSCPIPGSVPGWSSLVQGKAPCPCKAVELRKIHIYLGKVVFLCLETIFPVILLC